MKKLLALALFGMVSATSMMAHADDYTLKAATITLSPPTVVSGDDTVATVAKFQPGEPVVITISGTTGSVTVTVDANGVATVTLSTPVGSGEYTVTATGVTSGLVATTLLTVTPKSASLAPLPSASTPAGGAAPAAPIATAAATLPTTGSDAFSTVRVALAVTIVGLLLVALTFRRRRSHLAAADS